MDDICCIGHITLDKVITTRTTLDMAGGTSFYFSNAICKMDVRYRLVTALAESEMGMVAALRSNGINVTALPSKQTVYFENSYSENMDHRTQRVLQKADAFTVAQLADVSARIFHLGPLLADDMPPGVIKTLAAKGRVSLDVQGYLRKVDDKKVIPVDWCDKAELLKYISILKANEHEMEVLTGYKDVKQGAIALYNWGVKEVVITLGHKGSVIYAGDGFYHIPAYRPLAEVDATGCGDTYMAGYLYQRVKGAGFQQAGEFGAAMASLKIESAGPFRGHKSDVLRLLNAHHAAIKQLG